MMACMGAGEQEIRVPAGATLTYGMLDLDMQA
jgi:hypothetical protein